jgi:MFS family permease
MKFGKANITLKVVNNEMRSVLGSKKVALLCTAGFVTFFAFIGIMSCTADFVSLPPLSLEGHQIALILAGSGLAQIILALPGGLILDWLGRRTAGYIGFLSAAGISFVFIYASNYVHFIFLAAMFGFSSVLIWAVLMTLSVEIIPEKKIYVAAVFNSFRFFGYAVSPALLSLFYEKNGIDNVYLICSISFTLGVILIYLLLKNARSNSINP